MANRLGFNSLESMEKELARDLSEIMFPMINPERIRVVDALKALFPPATDGYWDPVHSAYVHCCDKRFPSGMRCTLPPDHPEWIHVAHDVGERGEEVPATIPAAFLMGEVEVDGGLDGDFGGMTIDADPFLLQYVKDRLNAARYDLDQIAEMLVEDT